MIDRELFGERLTFCGGPEGAKYYITIDIIVQSQLFEPMSLSLKRKKECHSQSVIRINFKS